MYLQNTCKWCLMLNQQKYLKWNKQKTYLLWWFKATVSFQNVALVTQAQIATSHVSIQVMDGNAEWIVTVQSNIAAFKLDALISCAVSSTLF